MVDDPHVLAVFVDLGCFDKVRGMYIHDNQQGIRLHILQRCLRLHKGGIKALLQQTRVQLLDHVGTAVEDNLDRLAHLLDWMIQTDCRAQTVQIGKTVTHNQHIRAGIEQLHQSRCHDSGLDLGALLNSLRNTAVEFVAVLVFDRCLVAASSQRHIQRLTGKLFCLQKALCIPAYADGKGRGHPAVGVDFSHGIQDGETFLDNAAHIPLLKGNKEAVLLQLFNHAVVVFDITFNLVFDLAHNLRAFIFTRALQQLLVVVDEDDGCHRSGGKVLPCDALELVVVHQIQYIQAVVLLAGGCVVGGVLVSIVLDSIPLHRTFGLQIDRRKIFCQAVPKAVAAAKHLFPHLVVVPDDFSASSSGHQNRQRKIPQRFVGVRGKLFFHRLIELVDALA